MKQCFPRFVKHRERVTLRNVEIDRMAIRALVDIHAFLNLANSASAIDIGTLLKLTECQRILDLSACLRVFSLQLHILTKSHLKGCVLSLTFVEKFDKALRFGQSILLKVGTFRINLFVDFVDVSVDAINATI